MVGLGEVGGKAFEFYSTAYHDTGITITLVPKCESSL